LTAAGGKVVGHVDAAVLLRGVGGDVRIRKKGEGVGIARFAKQAGKSPRGQRHAGSGERGAF
jgi:hypothetical protein